MPIMSRLLVIFVPLVGLMACGSVPASQLTLEQKLAQKNYRLGAPVEYIQRYRLDGWNYLDHEHVIMQTEPSTYYLVTLSSPCYDLLAAEKIAFTTTTGQLTRLDKLLVRGPGKIVQSCYIVALHKLEKTPKKSKES